MSEVKLLMWDVITAVKTAEEDNIWALANFSFSSWSDNDSVDTS